MQDGGEPSLSLPLHSSSVFGDVASAAATGLQAGSSGSSENRIFVVATLAAIVLAGSAFAYRARPHAVISDKNTSLASSIQETKRDMVDSQPHVQPGVKGKVPEGLSILPKDTQDPKESKSSRSKDRRRRGKDTLKDVLKNPKKLKSLVNSTPTSTPPLSALSTNPTTSINTNTPNTPNSPPSIHSSYHFHNDNETDEEDTDTLDFPSPFDEHTSSSNPSSRQGSISRSKGKQVLQRDFEQRRQDAWHDTLPIPGSSNGMISVTHIAHTSEVSQTDAQHPAQPHEPSHIQRHLSQSPGLSSTSGPDLDSHQHQVSNPTYAVPPMSSAPAMSQKYPTRPLSPSSTSPPSIVSTDNDDNIFGQPLTRTNPDVPLELDDLAAHTISQARARFLARDDTERLGLGLALHSPPTPPDLCCSALSSTSSSTESTELSTSTMTTSTSITSGAASTASAHDVSCKALQSSPNPPQLGESILNHSSTDSSSSVSSSKTKHASKPQQFPSAAASSSKAKQNSVDPWEWDVVSDAVCKVDSTRKEKDMSARDSPKKSSRKTGAASFSAVVAVVASSSPTQGASKELEVIEETPISFPTLNPTPSSSSRTKSSLEGSSTSTHQPSTPRRAPTPRRPQTPSYNSNNNSNCSTPPPPSSTSSSSSHHPGSSMPALSTQTQLASMRGALEASRLREEKNKAEMERVTKEMERLQWENANCKRGEMELRKQVAYLMHQVHSYAAMFATVSPQFNLHLQQQLQMRNQHAQNLSISSQSGAASGSGSTLTSSDSSTLTPDGAQASSSSAPSSQTPYNSTQPQDTPSSSPSTAVPASTPVASSGQPVPSSVPYPLQLSLLNGLPVNGNAGVASPMSAGPANIHPAQFFQYSFPQQLPGQHFPHQQMSHPQQHMLPFQHIGSPVQSSPHLAQFFNNAMPTNGRVVGVASPSPPSFGDGAFGLHHFHSQGSTLSPRNGSSGSLSPELNGSPNPSTSSKRQSRSRNQRLNVRAVWEDQGDGWIGTSGASRSESHDNHGQQDDAESEGGFNELLADAILKRPGSIRVRSPQKGKSNEDDRDAISESERMTEFAFPSLSDMGNILYRSGTRNVTEEYPTPSPSTMSSPSADPALSSLSSSPKKSSISVLSDSLDQASESSDLQHGISTDNTVTVGSPNADKTPRKEQTGAQIMQPPSQGSSPAHLSSAESSSTTDQQSSS